MEENEKASEGKEKADLGSLQYSVEFDFQKNEVIGEFPGMKLTHKFHVNVDQFLVT